MYERRFIVRNGLLDDGGWDRPCSAVCKLEDQGLAAYRRPKEGQLGLSPGGQGQGPGAPIPMSEGRRDGCLSSRRERIRPSSTFLPCYTPCRLDDASKPMWVRMNLFYSVYWVKHKSFLEIPSTDMPRNTILSVSWAFLSPEKLTLKMNFRRSVHTGTAPTWKDFLPSASWPDPSFPDFNRQTPFPCILGLDAQSACPPLAPFLG